MRNSSKKKQFGMNIGSASILLVFVILCLVSFASVGHGKSYVIPISDLQSLQVTIEILYPGTAEDSFYKITAWQVLNTDELQ